MGRALPETRGAVEDQLCDRRRKCFLLRGNLAEWLGGSKQIYEHVENYANVLRAELLRRREMAIQIARPARLL